MYTIKVFKVTRKSDGKTSYLQTRRDLLKFLNATEVGTSRIVTKLRNGEAIVNCKDYIVQYAEAKVEIDGGTEL